MLPQRTCSRCGAPIDGAAPALQCAACLLELGLDTTPCDAIEPGTAVPGEIESGRLPRDFGHFELLELVGRGGMGIVFRARDRRSNRIVALKMVRAVESASMATLARFQIEAKIAARLDHPQIVSVHETGELDGLPWFSMRWIEGRSLSKIIATDGPRRAADGGPNESRRLALLQRRVAGQIASVARALHYAHQRGVLHRDLKPANVLVDRDGRPYLTDFGIARLLEEPSGLTRTADLIGTPSYMAPEVASGGQATVASEVYSLGAILYECLAGRPPFAGRTTLETLRQVADEEPSPIRNCSPSVAADLETVCLKCLEKNPENRYPGAEALAEDLERFLRDEPIVARTTGPVKRLVRWCRRQPLLATALGSLVVLLITGVVVVLAAWQRAERHAWAEAHERQRAESAMEQLLVDNAEGLLEAQDLGGGLAGLAWVLRQNPGHRVAAGRLISALTHRSIALPEAELSDGVGATALADSETPVPVDALPLPFACFSPEGSRVLTLQCGGRVQVWNAVSGQPLGPPLGQGHSMLCAAFSPDGSRVATGGLDGNGRLWDAETGEPVGESLSHGSPVHRVDFEARGERLLTVGTDQAVRIWDLRDGDLAGLLLRHGTRVSAALFSPDGERVVTAGADGQVHVWETATGRELISPLTHLGEVVDARFSPDGARVVTASFDETARVWDSRTGQPLTPSLRHGHKVLTARFSPDGLCVVTASTDRRCRVWDASNGALLIDLADHQHWVGFADFSPDGQRFLSASHDGTVRVYDRLTGRNLIAPIRHDHEVTAAAFSTTGARLLTASMDGRVRLWNIEPGQALEFMLPHDDKVRRAEFSPDGRWIATASSDGSARLWRSASGEPACAPLRHRDDVWMAAFNPASDRLATGSWDGTVRVWKVPSGEPVTDGIAHAGFARCVRFSPEGGRIVTGSRDGTVRVWDAATGKPVSESMRHTGEIYDLGFTPDGARVASASDDRTARLWDAASGHPVSEPLRHGGPVVAVGFDAGGARLLTASTDGAARVWDGRHGTAMGLVLRHGGWLTAARFSPDGTRIVTASSEGSARLWDAASGRLLARPLKHRQWVSDAVFSPDGDRVATSSTDETARLWDADTGRPISEPLRHASAVESVRFSPDGRWLVTAARDRTARVWPVPPVENPVPSWLPELAEAVGGRRLTSLLDDEPAPVQEFLRMRNALKEAGGIDPHSRWARWFLADRTRRVVSPESDQTVPAYLDQLLRTDSLAAVGHAAVLSPANAAVFAELALALLRQKPPHPPARVAGAAWGSRWALTLDPALPETWQARASVRALTNDLPLAEAAMRAAVGRATNQPQFWIDWGVLRETDGESDEALAAFSRAIGLTESPGAAQSDLRSRAYSCRAHLFKRLGRLAEAVADNLAAWRIPARDPTAGGQLVDLSLHYNAGLTENWHGDLEENSYAALPTGVRRMAGIDFDVRGLIQLDGSGSARFPGEVTGIRVGRRCQRLHVLHAAIHGNAPGETLVGVYRLHFANGAQRDLPIMAGLHVRDWWQTSGEGPLPAETVVAWEGTNGKSRRFGLAIRLFKTVIDNPCPDEPLEWIDFVARPTSVAPFLVAVTLE